MFIFDVYWTTFYFLGCMLKFRLPNLYTITRVSKIKKRLLNKEKVKGFFIFMTILSFKQVEYNHSKKKPCKQGCSSIIKFSHCLSFEYCKYGFIYLFIYLFFNLNSKWLYMLHAQRKKSLKWTSVGKPFSGNLEG